jgi:hypothetical protein
MKTLNDLKELILSIFYSIELKYRLHIPFLIFLITFIYMIINPSLSFWRQTIGYDLLGLFYFVLIFSIINLVEIRKNELKRKVLFLIENCSFVVFYFLVHRMFTLETGLLSLRGSYSYSEGFFPLLKISVIFLVITFVLNRKKLPEINKNSI